MRQQEGVFLDGYLSKEDGNKGISDMFGHEENSTQKSFM